MTNDLRPSLKQKLRSIGKTNFVEGVHKAGISHLLGNKFAGIGSVFMFHEIMRDKDDRLGQGFTITDFEAVLNFIAKKGRDFVTLSEAKRRLQEEGENAKPFVALTFDDGYRDNIELALPVMEKFQAPATIFVPTEMATREINAWWLALRELVTLNSVLDIEPLGEVFTCETTAEKSNLYWLMIAWIWDDFTRANAFEAVLQRYGVQMPDLVARYAMDVDEVRSADHHPLISIGAHTVSHRALATLSDEEALAEMENNKLWLEDLLQREVPHFAYPYGRPAIGGGREAALARAAGFDIAVTTDAGNVFEEHGQVDNLMLWPRENGELSSDVRSSTAWALNGTWRALRSRLSEPRANIGVLEAYDDENGVSSNAVESANEPATQYAAG